MTEIPLLLKFKTRYCTSYNTLRTPVSYHSVLYLVCTSEYLVLVVLEYKYYEALR